MERTMIKLNRPTATVRLATDLSARQAWEQAVEDEAIAAKQSARRRVNTPELADARARQDAAQEAMAASELLFTLRGLPRAQYTALVAAHPPHEGVEQDADQGVHVATFGDALLIESIIAVNGPDGSVVDFDPRREWQDLADEMTDGQWSDFYRAVVNLNKAAIAVPRKRAS